MSTRIWALIQSRNNFFLHPVNAFCSANKLQPPEYFKLEFTTHHHTLFVLINLSTLNDELNKQIKANMMLKW